MQIEKITVEVVKYSKIKVTPLKSSTAAHNNDKNLF